MRWWKCKKQGNISAEILGEVTDNCHDGYKERSPYGNRKKDSS
jgi:hypothetical protein